MESGDNFQKGYGMGLPENDDKFVAMATARADVTLPLSDFHPRSMLITEEHLPERARFPVIDCHNHLDALDPDHVIKVMDACAIEHIVNITMQTGDAALRMIDKYRNAGSARFSTIAWMD